MLPNFCLNPYSLHFSTRYTTEEVYAYLDKILLLLSSISRKLRKNKRADKIYFFLDDENSEVQYKFSEYMKSLKKRSPTLYQWIGTIQTRSPYYKDITEDDFLNLIDKTILIYDKEYSNAHIFYFAYIKNGSMLSIPIENIWKKEKLDFSVKNKTETRSYSVNNIYENTNETETKILNDILQFEGKNKLKDTSRFLDTNKTNKSEKIYKEILTGRLWYYDDAHDKNGRPHFEVFDQTGRNFIGEFDMNLIKIPNSEKGKDNRKIKL